MKAIDRGPAEEAAWERLSAAVSWLFVPGDKVSTWLDGAVASGADVVVVDLEDAVSPGRKELVRESVRRILAEPLRPALAVRVNAVGTPWWLEDVEMAVAGGASVLMIPKVTSAEDVEHIADVAAGVTTRRSEHVAPSFVPIIETAKGVLHAEAISSAPHVVAVALGAADLAADLRVAGGDRGTWLDHARAHVILASAAAGCGALDTPVLGSDGLGLVASEAEVARHLGFTGKLAIHPDHVAVIVAAFEPSEEEILRAHRVVDAFADAARAGEGVASVDGEMVDAPVAAAAQRLLTRVRPSGAQSGP